MIEQLIRKTLPGVFVTLGLFALAGTVQAGPITFNFQNSGADTPEGVEGVDFTTGGTCNDTSITNIDICETGSGLDYLKSGLSLNVTASNTNDPVDAFLMQDLAPDNSGLAVITKGDTSSDDQVQVATGESILFSFGREVNLLGFDFNNGADLNCNSTDTSEGDCGYYDLFVDGALTAVGNFEALDDYSFSTDIIGTTFRVVHTGPSDGGFAIGSVTVEVPEPGTLALLGLGLAGLGLARRRKA